MKQNTNFSFIVVIAIFLSISNLRLYGQEIVNNSQTETIKLPLKKVVRYFDNFNDSSMLQYSLKETKVDSISRNENIATIYLTENKNYVSANIFTDLNLYKKTIREKSFESNIIMLYKGEYNKETLKYPIKPMIHESFSKKGILKWKVNIEGIDENSTKLTFIFDSFDEKSKQNFISNFTKEIDNYFNYAILKIYVCDNFKFDILKYLENYSKSDASDVPPTKGN
ncbi:hypothetical protein [Sphingobacterium detergens]|uniref:Uncharacterized protein n=1 Tax=Sphingobacterium detergens TaxID=1145106 RepID=A0A420BHA0_SPHD1|nr:hypothetical protein [Sphingobacterium detergens]RKE56035.1 hypothetical protein DFQ12_0887 [Sphingobacterium detergens]